MGLKRAARRAVAWGIGVGLLVACAAPSAVETATPVGRGMDHSSHGAAMQEAGIPFDAGFIDDMIIHHEGAVVMAEEALAQADRAEVRELAEAIMAAQATEIEQMQAWRAEWFPDVEATEGMGMDMGMMSVPEDAAKPYDQRWIGDERTGRDSHPGRGDHRCSDGGDRDDAGVAGGVVRRKPVGLATAAVQLANVTRPAGNLLPVLILARDIGS
jgi:hypothetical protein